MLYQSNIRKGLINCFDLRSQVTRLLCRVGSGEAPSSRLKLPSPGLSKKQKEKDKGKMRKHKKDQKGPEARLLQERCVHCHQLFSQVNNSIEREIFEMRRLHLVWQSSRIVPVCSRCAEARYRVHVLSCLCQVSSLPLSLRGWKLYRWEPLAQYPPTDPLHFRWWHLYLW